MVYTAAMNLGKAGCSKLHSMSFPIATIRILRLPMSEEADEGEPGMLATGEGNIEEVGEQRQLHRRFRDKALTPCCLFFVIYRHAHVDEQSLGLFLEDILRDISSVMEVMRQCCHLRVERHHLALAVKAMRAKDPHLAFCSPDALGYVKAAGHILLYCHFILTKIRR